MKKVFIDTNVLLDVLAARVPFYDDAAAILSLAEKRKFEICISAISFTTIFYLLRKALDAKEARAALRRIHGAFTIVACDERILSFAIDCKIKDFEDAVQYFSASQAKADFFVTRNTRDFPADLPIPPTSPKEFLKQWC